VGLSHGLGHLGGGAAGGIGAALSVFLGAKMGSGIDTLLDIVDFDSALKNADRVISGEGRLDSQSLSGKVIYGIAKRCQNAGVPLYLIVGGVGDGWEKAYELGIKKIYTLVDENTTLGEAITNAEEVYRARATKLFSDIRGEL
jgi:glycerate kinase